MNLSFSYVSSLLFLALAVLGTTTMIVDGSNGTSQAWADVIEGTEGPDEIVGTPEDDIIDSKGGRDENHGDTTIGDGSGNDVINSGEESDFNSGDTFIGDGSGNDVINSGENSGEGGDDQEVNFGDTFIGDGS